MKKVEKSSSAGTKDESSTNAQDSQVCQPIAKPHVVRSCIQEENLYTPNCIRTFSGIYMNVFEPTLEMICIEDIAHALSMQPRFGGHLPVFYSVAQHSVLCSNLANEASKFQALLHDASEAYLLDVPRPIKLRLSNYKQIEEKLMSLIGEKFGFDSNLSESTKTCDEYMLQWEWSRLMLKRDIFRKIEPWSQNYAKEMFLSTFEVLVSVPA